MKTLSIIVASFLALTASAQNLAVQFYGTNSQSIPQFWPKYVQPIGSSTNVPVGFVLLTQPQLNSIVSTNQSAYNTTVSNATFTVTSGNNSNYFAWYNLYTNLPAGISDSYTRSNTMWLCWQTNILIAASINAGTNSAAQDHTRFVQWSSNSVTQSQTMWIDQIYLHNLIQYLSRLGPGLQGIYQPSSDPVGH